MKKSACKFILFVFLSLFAAVSSFAVPSWTYSALDYFSEAEQLRNRNDFLGATELYREALELNPKYGDAWYSLALCCYNLKNYDLALEYAGNAEKYSKNMDSVRNLQGMSLVCLGRLDEAEKIFSSILETSPNNIDARFGLAELDLLDGKISSAEFLYSEALKRDGTNRKALLSLALVSAEMGKTEAAANYISQALESHSGSSEVHYLAAYLAAKSGNLREAELRARSAIQIQTDFDDAYALLSSILYTQGRYDEVLDICLFRIGRNRNLSDAWYLMGLSQKKKGDVEGALKSFETGLSLNPQDEVMRACFEQTVADNIPVEDSRRQGWASFHISKAREYAAKFDGPGERFEYQKALSVAPLDLSVRQNFADLLSREGLYELYLKQLDFISANSVPIVTQEDNVRRNENSPEVKKTAVQIRNEDSAEALRNLMAGNLSERWNVDPFYLDKTRWNIGLYFQKKNVRLIHADLEEIAVRAAGDIFSAVPSTSVDVLTEPIGGYSDAFRHARSSGRDYFIIISPEESERSFGLKAYIYSARTGTKTTEIDIYRTGNDCMARTLRRFRRSVLDILPVRGKIVSATNGTLLVDLGRSDGITAGSKFDVVRRGSIRTKDRGPGITYDEKNILGTFTAVTVNEELCSGEYKKRGFYDVMNAGDEVVLVELSENSGSSESVASSARPAADSSGEPVVQNSESNEDASSVKEALKIQARESELVGLIRNII